MCEYSNFYFESDEFVALFLHILTVIEIPLHLFGGFIIVFKTPKKMEMVRGVLMFLHVWEAALDFFLSVAIPIIFFPAAIGYPVGPFEHVGMPSSVQIYVVISGIGGLATAAGATFENRYYRIVRNDPKTLVHSWKRLALVLFNYFLCFTCLLPVYAFSEEQEIGKAYYRKLYPCIPNEIFDRENLFVLTTNVLLLSGLLAALTIFVSCQTFFYISATISKLKSLKIFSKNTYKMQHKLFISLCYQATVLAGAIILPFSYTLFSFITGYFNQVMNNFAIILFCLHGTFSSIVMLMIYTPYRQAIQNLIFKHKTPKLVFPTLSSKIF